jgi:polyhydroxyalkanoate synthesis regulator phasin
MAEEIIIQEEITTITQNNVIIGGTRKVVVTAVGLGAVAQEKSGQLFTKLIEQGETRQAKRQARLEVLAQRRAETNKRVSAELDRRIGNWLNLFNLPSKADIEALTAKINDISERLEVLNAQEATPVQPAEIAEEIVEA